ncbi:MAG: hypothetical protein LBU83_00205 [Bacteroidales bacterium]|nr:hypothetical protein [Bacteroidales bacterium]
MKKILLVVLLILTFSTTILAKPKKFCFDGMCFENKEWKNVQTGIDQNTTNSFIVSSKAVAGGFGGIAVFTILKIKPTEEITIEEYAEKRFLDQITFYNDSKNSSASNFTIVDQEGLAPFVINNIKAKVFGLKGKQGTASVYQRYFIFNKGGYLFEIQTTSNSSASESHTKLFLNILNSFTFEP